ncbi:SRPBCC domain-containing protein [Paenibacillus sp. NPDC058071]|uniref:SRPBCC family protein n=1 Tax=Paenibacillus sp. NPDC058071 TaxID=3346326 RepID=UPI0036D84146
MLKKKSANAVTSKAKGNTLLLERQFDATPEQVYEAYTKAEQLTAWWGPRGWTLPVCTVDLRPDGAWHYCIASADSDNKSWGKMIYKEIEPNVKLVYVDYPSDEEGIVNEGTGILITLSFQSHNGGTKLINRAEFVSSQALKRTLNLGVVEGMTQTWSRLAEHLRNTSS